MYIVALIGLAMLAFWMQWYAVGYFLLAMSAAILFMIIGVVAILGQQMNKSMKKMMGEK